MGQMSLSKIFGTPQIPFMVIFRNIPLVNIDPLWIKKNRIFVI